MSRRDSIIVGLDVGTSKVCVVVGERMAGGTLRVLGAGIRQSSGLSKGVVVNVEQTVESIQGAIEDAEVMADCEIREVVVGVGGGQIKSFPSHGIVAIKDGEVHTSDVRRVIEAARTVAMPNDREVLHVLPIGFVVDDQGGIRDPRGIRGVRLEVHCHIVTVTSATTETLVRCCHRAGLRVTGQVLEPLAGAEAALTDAEKDMGVALVDLGGGTTDLVIYVNGSVRHTAVLALGGSHITSDIAQILRTPATPSAEHLKLEYGCALASEAEDDVLLVPALGGGMDREVSRQVLCGIIEKRAEEILELVRREIDKSGYSASLTGGLVLTGGASQLPCLTDLGGRVFDLPTRLGGPTGLAGDVDLISGPEYSAAVGLVQCGMMPESGQETAFSTNKGFGAMVEKMRGWIREFF